MSKYWILASPKIEAGALVDTIKRTDFHEASGAPTIEYFGRIAGVDVYTCAELEPGQIRLIQSEPAHLAFLETVEAARPPRHPSTEIRSG